MAKTRGSFRLRKDLSKRMDFDALKYSINRIGIFLGKSFGFFEGVGFDYDEAPGFVSKGAG